MELNPISWIYLAKRPHNFWTKSIKNDYSVVMSEMVLARHSRRKKKSYRSHSWHEGAKPYFTVFSTSKHIVAEMHEAFSHLVDILVADAFPLQKCKQFRIQICSFLHQSSYQKLVR